MKSKIETNAIGPVSTDPGETRLNIKVIFTSPEGTAAALRAAQDLANQLNACLTVLVPEVIPFPLQVDQPQVSPRFLDERVRTLAEGLVEDLRVSVLLCRDKLEALLRVLEPRSIVLIGGRARWWLTEETALARKLERHGHHVVFVPSK